MILSYQMLKARSFFVSTSYHFYQQSGIDIGIFPYLAKAKFIQGRSYFEFPLAKICTKQLINSSYNLKPFNLLLPRAQVIS